jgi:hypothetical protein
MPKRQKTGLNFGKCPTKSVELFIAALRAVTGVMWGYQMRSRKVQHISSAEWPVIIRIKAKRPHAAYKLAAHLIVELPEKAGYSAITDYHSYLLDWCHSTISALAANLVNGALAAPPRVMAQLAKYVPAPEMARARQHAAAMPAEEYSYTNYWAEL